MTVMEQLLQEKLVIISRGTPKDRLVKAAVAMADVGIRFLEITFDHTIPDPLSDYREKVEALREALGDRMHIGAGTVLNVDEVRAAHSVGCEYIIAPNTNEDVIRETKKLGMLSIPGAMTPTEICRAWDLGADSVKLFPADDMGMHYITNLRGPLPHIPLIATGGVNPDTIGEYLSRGVNAVGTGITVLRRDLIEAEDYAGIAELAKKHIDAVKAAL